MTHYHRQEALKDLPVATAVAEAAARDIPPTRIRTITSDLSAPLEALLAAIMTADARVLRRHEKSS